MVYDTIAEGESKDYQRRLTTRAGPADADVQLPGVQRYGLFLYTISSD